MCSCLRRSGLRRSGLKKLHAQDCFAFKWAWQLATWSCATQVKQRGIITIQEEKSLRTFLVLSWVIVLPLTSGHCDPLISYWEGSWFDNEPSRVPSLVLFFLFEQVVYT